jgi:hypothetical protein
MTIFEGLVKHARLLNLLLQTVNPLSLQINLPFSRLVVLGEFFVIRRDHTALTSIFNDDCPEMLGAD